MARERAEIELQVVTPHGAPVTGAEVRLIGAGGAGEGIEAAPGAFRLRFPRRGDYQLVVEPKAGTTGLWHRPLRSTIFYVPGGERQVLALGGPEGTHARVEEAVGEGGRRMLRVTLDYVWFSHVGFPPTTGNRADILVDGEAGWGSVAEVIAGAQRSLRLCTWQYQPSMEILRPDPLAEPSAREANTIQRMLAERARAGVLVQLLLWDAPILPMPGPARRAAGTPDDGFEVLEEKNLTARPLLDGALAPYNRLLGDFQIGSFHQKVIVADGQIAFCGGMNMRQIDWDTRLHRLFDARRCRFGRPAAHRTRVQDGQARADYPPRHDFVARIEGPAVAHLEENFRQRWNRLLSIRAPYAHLATLVPAIGPVAPIEGGAAVQVVRTMPAPYDERGILDVYLRAIAAAERLIYIEDQYFRSTHVSNAIAEALRRNPRLRVLVVTTEAQANHPLMGAWSRACFDRIREVVPDFVLYSLRALGCDVRGRRCVEEIDNHGKLMMVDDVFVTVGSCNVNDRGFEYEGECNVAVVDPALCERLRLSLFRDYLGDDPRLGQGIESDVAVWVERAAQNAKEPPADGGHPFAVPFVPRPRRRPIFDRSVF
jgi:phosphatidylserine/phosphatidylglycerophosphate/cardiolipin synthase-like enzyme